MLKQMEIKNLQWGSTSHQSEGPPRKSPPAAHATEAVEKREPSHTAGRNAVRGSHSGNQDADPSKKDKYFNIVEMITIEYYNYPPPFFFFF